MVDVIKDWFVETSMDKLGNPPIAFLIGLSYLANVDRGRITLYMNRFSFATTI